MADSRDNKQYKYRQEIQQVKSPATPCFLHLGWEQPWLSSMSSKRCGYGAVEERNIRQVLLAGFSRERQRWFLCTLQLVVRHEPANLGDKVKAERRGRSSQAGRVVTLPSRCPPCPLFHWAASAQDCLGFRIRAVVQLLSQPSIESASCTLAKALPSLGTQQDDMDQSPGCASGSSSTQSTPTASPRQSQDSAAAGPFYETRVFVPLAAGTHAHHVGPAAMTPLVHQSVSSATNLPLRQSVSSAIDADAHHLPARAPPSTASRTEPPGQKRQSSACSSSSLLSATSTRDAPRLPCPALQDRANTVTTPQSTTLCGTPSTARRQHSLSGQTAVLSTGDPSSLPESDSPHSTSTSGVFSASSIRNRPPPVFRLPIPQQMAPDTPALGRNAQENMAPRGSAMDEHRQTDRPAVAPVDRLAGHRPAGLLGRQRLAHRQPNPDSQSLGATNPIGAALFAEAFDEAATPSNRRLFAPPAARPSQHPPGAVAAGRDMDDVLAPDAGHVDGSSGRGYESDGASAPTASLGRTPAAAVASAGAQQAALGRGDAEDCDDDAADFKEYLADNIAKMMYVSGETGEPSAETTGMIEEIVRQQVIELLRNATELAARRGSRSITINDLIFQIRDDAPKVSRLRTFLSWKDVRKNVKDSDDKGGDADLAAAEDPVGGVVAGPVEDTAKKNKKSKVGLPWDPSSFYSQEVPEREDEEDEEEEEMNYITLQRLRKADERTKAMTKEEYVTWSEYRQASFTYRKSKRFREWAGFSVITDSKPSDDIVDILGFLTFEMVQNLTEEALKIKDHEDLLRERTGEAGGSSSKKRKLAQGLFDPPGEGRTPVEPRHIQEAFRRMQARPKKSRAMLSGTRLQQRTNLKLI
ncbi:hypothetical protein VTK73DRAFT_1970 [Phialemonium thermophilum]|uniref:Uncharacterized protein n=1 Tax=Phialemonium thermophilum TaxID=223376 RepID=A0ABR3VST7_9PEZI